MSVRTNATGVGGSGKIDEPIPHQVNGVQVEQLKDNTRVMQVTWKKDKYTEGYAGARIGYAKEPITPDNNMSNCNIVKVNSSEDTSTYINKLSTGYYNILVQALSAKGVPQLVQTNNRTGIKIQIKESGNIVEVSINDVTINKVHVCNNGYILAWNSSATNLYVIDNDNNIHEHIVKGSISTIYEFNNEYGNIGFAIAVYKSSSYQYLHYYNCTNNSMVHVTESVSNIRFNDIMLAGDNVLACATRTGTSTYTYNLYTYKIDTNSFTKRSSNYSEMFLMTQISGFTDRVFARVSNRDETHIVLADASYVCRSSNGTNKKYIVASDGNLYISGSGTGSGSSNYGLYRYNKEDSTLKTLYTSSTSYYPVDIAEWGLFYAASNKCFFDYDGKIVHEVEYEARADEYVMINDKLIVLNTSSTGCVPVACIDESYNMITTPKIQYLNEKLNFTETSYHCIKQYMLINNMLFLSILGNYCHNLIIVDNNCNVLYNKSISENKYYDSVINFEYTQYGVHILNTNEWITLEGQAITGISAEKITYNGNTGECLFIEGNRLYRLKSATEKELMSEYEVSDIIMNNEYAMLIYGIGYIYKYDNGSLIPFVEVPHSYYIFDKYVVVYKPTGSNESSKAIGYDIVTNDTYTLDGDYTDLATYQYKSTNNELTSIRSIPTNDKTYIIKEYLGEVSK